MTCLLEVCMLCSWYLNCEIWYSHNGIAEDSSLLECDIFRDVLSDLSKDHLAWL